MKAIVRYQNGWILEMPITGNAPMLLLEWVSKFRMGKMPIDKVINRDSFQIRFSIPKVEIEKCAEYINANYRTRRFTNTPKISCTLNSTKLYGVRPPRKSEVSHYSQPYQKIRN